MIQAEHLTKRYGERLAVGDLSFTIHPGQVAGFLGPNGAGKSTIGGSNAAPGAIEAR
jgi:ABC-2 type transport system ATP-binding protein